MLKANNDVRGTVITSHIMRIWMGVTFMLSLVLLPVPALTRVPPLLPENPIREGVVSDASQSWSAFRSETAQNICVTVVNFGGSRIFVHLFQQRSLAGVFTVLPHHTSAMCSEVTHIELECEVQGCRPHWYISESF